MSARGWLVAVLLVAGCGGGGTFVSVSVDRVGSLGDVASVDLLLDLDGRPASTTLREANGGPIVFPTSVTLSFGNNAGTLTVTAIARDAAGVELARDLSSVRVVVGETSSVVLHLRGSDVTGDDMAVGDDMAIGGDMAGAAPDLAMVDLSMPPADLATADLSMPRDLSMPPD